MKTINHIDDPKFGALNPDCPCDECTEIDWDAQCINCSLKARDCFGQDHYTPEERLRGDGGCPECDGQHLNEDQNRCFDCEPYEVRN